jgi:hypothetical protein
MAMGRFRVGYPRVWVWFGFFAHGFRVRSPQTYRVRFRIWFFTRGYPMDNRNKSL